MDAIELAFSCLPKASLDLLKSTALSFVPQLAHRVKLSTCTVLLKNKVCWKLHRHAVSRNAEFTNWKYCHTVQYKSMRRKNMQLGEGGAATVYEAEVLSRDVGDDFDSHLAFAVKKASISRFSPDSHWAIAGASSLSTWASFTSVLYCRWFVQMQTNLDWRK